MNEYITKYQYGGEGIVEEHSEYNLLEHAFFVRSLMSLGDDVSYIPPEEHRYIERVIRYPFATFNLFFDTRKLTLRLFISFDADSVADKILTMYPIMTTSRKVVAWEAKLPDNHNLGTVATINDLRIMIEDTIIMSLHDYIGKA